MLGLISEQHKYNLLCRLPELEVLPAARFLGIGVIAYSPLAGGLLGGAALTPVQGSRSEKIRDRAELYRSQIERFASVCRELDQPPACVAIAWVLSHPALTAAIVGPRTLYQFEGILGATDIDLNDLLKTDIAYMESNQYVKNRANIQFDLDRNIPTVRGHYIDFTHAISGILEFSWLVQE